MIVIIVIVVFFIISEKIFERTNFYKNNYLETDKLKGTSKVDYVNTGSTFAYYGIDYEYAGVKGLNLALCPQSIEFDFNMLRHFESRYNKGAVVFIIISDLAFAKRGYKEAKTVEKYYKVLSIGEIKRYNLFKALRAKYLPVLYSWKNFLRAFRDVNISNDHELMVNENDKEAVEADAYKRCKAWVQEFGLDNLSDMEQGEKFRESFEFNTSIVSRMAAWCKERGYKPVLVNLPVSSEMINGFSKEFLDVFYYENIKKFDDVPFIDLQAEEKLSDYLLYTDSCRLNKPGRGIITKLLIRKVEELDRECL